jgi:hypothetical protein
MSREPHPPQPPLNHLDPIVHGIHDEVDEVSVNLARAVVIVGTDMDRQRREWNIVESGIRDVQIVPDNQMKYWTFMAALLAAAGGLAVISGAQGIWKWVQEKRMHKQTEEKLEATRDGTEPREKDTRKTRLHARSWDFDWDN